MHVFARSSFLVVVVAWKSTSFYIFSNRNFRQKWWYFIFLRLLLLIVFQRSENFTFTYNKQILNKQYFTISKFYSALKKNWTFVLTHHPPKAKNFFTLFGEIFSRFLPQNLILKIFRNFSKILIFLTLSPAETKKSLASPAKGGKFFLPHAPAQEKS